MVVAGIIAGPLYVIVSLIEIVSRDGFDPRRHAWSQLANGDWGWIHSTNLIVSGLLIVLAGYAWKNRAGLFLALYGLGMVVAGFFTADAGRGFPAGAPETVPLSTHGLIHFAAGGVGFVGLIIACFLMRSRLVGTLFALAYVALIAGGGAAWSLLTFTAAVIMVSVWITATSLRLTKSGRSNSPRTGRKR
ncbi:DUF998 domain-containing protein [Actinoplanes sp. NPDC089786]|uniref:DUF998 domain-containing protein n=1 Tax=Actinoplanes sp. NPDC089786 TaxID=3155185 RepID=UPI0034327A58